MNTVDLLNLIGTLWPIFVGIITLIFVLSRLWTDVESLKEKVKDLFRLHNSRRNGD
jgi:hypothetical protein